MWAARPARTLPERLPSIIIKPYDDHESITQALLSKEIDVIVAWMSYDHWRKETLQGTVDKILLIDEYPLEMVTYIRKDWPELIPILNKALADKLCISTTTVKSHIQNIYGKLNVRKRREAVEKDHTIGILKPR